MKIMVTGATSMIGTALIKEALQYDTEIYAIVRPGSKRIGRLPVSEKIYLIECGLRELDDVEEITNADVFYHLGWTGTEKVNRDNPIVQEENIRYSLDAVELAARCHCKRFIGAGSQAEYGITVDCIDETAPTHPNVAYGMAKLSASMLCEKTCKQKGMEFIWARLFSVYGTNDNFGTMLEYAIQKFISGEKAEFSKATQMWNYLFEEDAGKIFYLLGQGKETGIINIANKISRPLREYIEEVADVCRNKFGFKTEYVFASKQDNNVVSLNPDTRKMRKSTGDFEMTSFKKGIENIIALKLSDNSGGG